MKRIVFDENFDGVDGNTNVRDANFHRDMGQCLRELELGCNGHFGNKICSRVKKSQEESGGGRRSQEDRTVLWHMYAMQ